MQIDLKKIIDYIDINLVGLKSKSSYDELDEVVNEAQQGILEDIKDEVLEQAGVIDFSDFIKGLTHNGTPADSYNPETQRSFTFAVNRIGVKILDEDGSQICHVDNDGNVVGISPNLNATQIFYVKRFAPLIDDIFLKNLHDGNI